MPAIPSLQLPGFNTGMDRTPPALAHSRARLAAALDRVDSAMAGPELAWPDRLARLGMWGSWLLWILRLLAFEFGQAGDEYSWLSDADHKAGAARSLSQQALDRKIDRVIAAAAHLWDPDREAAARWRRPRFRRLLQLVLRGKGARHARVLPVPVIIRRVTSAPVLALCKP